MNIESTDVFNPVFCSQETEIISLNKFLVNCDFLRVILEFVIMNHLDLPIRVLCTTEGDCITVAAVEVSGIISFAVAASTGSVGAINSVRKARWVYSTALFFTDRSFTDLTLGVVVKVGNTRVNVTESGNLCVEGVGVNLLLNWPPVPEKSNLDSTSPDSAVNHTTI